MWIKKESHKLKKPQVPDLGIALYLKPQIKKKP